MANVTGGSLTPIYNRLNGAARSHPFEANTFADPSTEAGDEVTISSDGTSYTSPIDSMSFTWKKGITATMRKGGEEKRGSISRMSSRKYRGGSSGLRNTHYQHIYVDDLYNQMRSGLELTGSTASLYVQNMYNQMKAGLDLTSSSASLYVRNLYNQMKAGLDLTSSSAALYVDNKYNQMKAGLDLTSSSASLYVDNKYNQMKAGLDLTSSSASLYVRNLYNQMKSGLDLTSSSAALYVDNKYNQMKAGLDLTSSSASLYVRNLYNQMKAGLDLTSSSASLYVRNLYNQMKAGLDLTSSSASVYVRNLYNQMKSGLDLTSSSAAVYVRSLYNQMKSGLALTMSSAALYVQNRTTKAQILLAINGSGKSEALVEADSIKIGTSSNTDIKLSDAMSIDSNGGVYVKKNLVVSNSYSGNMKTLNIGENGSIKFADAGGNIGTQTLNIGKVANLITALQVVHVSGTNNYKLQKKTVENNTSWSDVANSTFSRAVSSWIWGGGSGKINVTALPQNQTKSVKVSIDGTNSITSNGTYTYTVDYENGDGDDVSTGATKSVTVSIPYVPTALTQYTKDAGTVTNYTKVNSYGSGSIFYYNGSPGNRIVRIYTYPAITIDGVSRNLNAYSLSDYLSSAPSAVYSFGYNEGAASATPSSIKNWQKVGDTWYEQTGSKTIGINGSITLVPWADNYEGSSVTISVSKSSATMVYQGTAQGDEGETLYMFVATRDYGLKVGKAKTFYY